MYASPSCWVTLPPCKQALKVDLHNSICQGPNLAPEGVNAGTANQDKRLKSLCTHCGPTPYCFLTARWLHPSIQRPYTNNRIDLFTDTAAILNLLDLRSIMGCPGGTRSVFKRAFRAKRELQCAFFGKKAIIITPKHGTTIFFSHYILFLGKRKEKLARKARVNSERVHQIVLMPPGQPIILLKSN